MARKKSTSEIIVPTAIEQAAAETQPRQAVARADAARFAAAQTRAAELRSACARFGYAIDGDITAEAVEADIVYHLRQHKEYQCAADASLFRVGVGLLVLKEGCSHGEWLVACQRVGFNRAYGWRLMEVARRFTQCNDVSNVLSTQHLPVQMRYPRLTETAGNISKLFELTVLDDDELRDLESTGEVLGLSMADVGAASMRKLRQMIRDAKTEQERLERELTQTRKDLEGAHRRAGEQAAKIESLNEQLRHKPPADDECWCDWEEQMQRLAEYATNVRVALSRLAAQVREAREVSTQAGRDDGVYLSSLLQQVENDAAVARHEIGLPEIGRGNAALDFIDAMTGEDGDENQN